jgi:NADH-quinone oxidoreductase subunit E
LISGGGGSSSGSDSSYGQRAASPTYLAEAGGQGFASDANAKASSDGPAVVAGTGAATAGAAASDDEGERPPALAAARDGKADDLKKISGVGPKLEGTLNGLGIFHFSQIAEFTPSHVSWVDRHLRFKGRIARENWLDQAKILAAGGETEFSKRRRR